VGGIDVTGANSASDVRALVAGADRLFGDLVVAALRRGGVTAWNGHEYDISFGEPHVVVAEDRVAPCGPSGQPPHVLLVHHDDRPTRRRARLMAARACVPSAATSDELVETVVRVANGEDLLTTTRCEDDRLLTSREIDVLHLMAAGHDNAAIARHLDISPHTARTHVQRILTKFDVRNRFSAVSAARGRGFLRSHT